MVGHGQHAVLDLGQDLVLRDARQVERVDELAVGLPRIERRHPRPGLAAVAFEEAAHEPAELVVHRGDLAERVPANKCGHVSTSFIIWCYLIWCYRQDKT